LTTPDPSDRFTVLTPVKGGEAVQTTIYFSEDDKYLIDLVDQVARRERKSRSAVVLSILEEHFERGKRLGEILVDMGFLGPKEVERALAKQKEAKDKKLFGEILVEEGLIPPDAVERALAVQTRFRDLRS